MRGLNPSCVQAMSSVVALMVMLVRAIVGE